MEDNIRSHWCFDGIRTESYRGIEIREHGLSLVSRVWLLN